MKINTLFASISMAVALLVGANAHASLTQTNTEIQTTPIIGYTGYVPPCSGYCGIVAFTNSTGGTLVVPPAGATQLIFSDLSHPGSGYVSCLSIKRRSDNMTWTGQSNLVISVSGNSDRYSLQTTINDPYPSNASSQTVTNRLVFH